MIKTFSLAACRVNAGLTRQQIAQELNIPKNTYSNYEIGKTPMPATVALKFSQICDVPIEYIKFPK